MESISVEQAQKLMSEYAQLKTDTASYLKKNNQFIEELTSENTNLQNHEERVKKNEELNAEKDLLLTRLQKIDEERLVIQNIAIKIGLILADNKLQ